MSSCAFKVNLSENARLKIKESLEEHLQASQIDISKSGNLIFSYNCERFSKKEVEEFLTWLGFKKQSFYLKCETQDDLWRLRLHVIQIDKSSIKTLNLEQTLAQLENLFSHTQKDSFLSSKLNTTIISSPVITLLPFKAFSIHQGMELAYTSYKKSEVATDWKRSGLEVEGKLLSMVNGKVQFDFDISVSRPSKKGAVTRSSMSTQLWIEPNRASYVGLLETQVYSGLEEDDPIISSLPFIGSFLK